VIYIYPQRDFYSSHLRDGAGRFHKNLKLKAQMLKLQLKAEKIISFIFYVVVLSFAI